MKKLSIQKSYAGRHLFLTGASGFVGKVWLSLLLSRVPEFAKIYLLIRKGKAPSAPARFETLFETSPAFRPLHESWGEELPSYLREKIEVIEGDVSLLN